MTPLSNQEFLLFALLVRRQAVSKDQAISHLWGMAPECDLPDDPWKVIDVLICRIRRCIEQRGIRLDTSGRGRGQHVYFFTAENRERARYFHDNYWAIIAGEKPSHKQLELAI